MVRSSLLPFMLPETSMTNRRLKLAGTFSTPIAVSGWACGLSTFAEIDSVVKATSPSASRIV